MGGHTRLRRRGLGGANLDDRPETLALGSVYTLLCPIKNVKRKLAGNTVHPYGPIGTTLDPHQLPLDSTFKICFTRPYNVINHIKVLRFRFYKKQLQN